jgi:fructose-bisphosphate aldolase, class I
MDKNNYKPTEMHDWTVAQRRQLIVAIDHGLTLADIQGLERPFQLLDLLIKNERVDGIIASPGIYRQAETRKINMERLVRLITTDYVCFGRNGTHETLSERRIIINPEEASQYHPHSYKMFFNIYDDNDALINNVRDFSSFASAGKRLGISALAEVMFFNNSRFQDPAKQAAELLRGCRIAMESGADALKIPLISDHNAIGEMIDRIGLPTYILGGGSNQTTFIDNVKTIAQLPINGLMIGRNVWQSDNVNERIHQIITALDDNNS